MLFNLCEKFFLFSRYLDFCPDFSGHEENSLIRKLRPISKFMTSQTGKLIITIRILLSISRSRGNQTMKFDLVYFTTRVPDTSDTGDTSETRATRVRHEQHECDTSATRMTQVRHDWKILILIIALVKTYFHTPVFTIFHVKDYKDRNNLILRTTFWKSLVPMPKWVWKVYRKNWTLKWQKLYQNVLH